MGAIGEALEAAEPEGRYAVDAIVQLESNGAEIVVVSDLHLGDGRQLDGTFSGSEHFFADEAFARFLDRVHVDLDGRPGILVLNGDVVDFLRIGRTPDTDDEFARWAALLARLGRPKDESVLRRISPKERSYGLKTHDYKSAWKLAAIVRGHGPFFDALARFLDRGHRVIVVKGNHDLEWYWRLVRDTLRLFLAERMPGPSDDDAVAARIRGPIAERLSFVDHALVFDDLFYVEHGHRFDRYSHVVDGATLAGGEELNIPFGSFFNRYLVNKIELAYPFIDNVRPRENLLPVLMRERFSLGLRLMSRVPWMLCIIPARYYSYMFRKFALTVLSFVLPIAAVVVLEWNEIMIAIGHVQRAASTTAGEIVGKALRDVAALLTSYLLARLVAHFELVEPSTLAKQARRVFRKDAKYRYVTFGHTHDPDTFEDGGRWFHNTGTWIPIVEASSAKIRHDRTYTFLHFTRSDDGGLAPGRLLRWNDDAERADPAVLVQRTVAR
jgi:UDP-2,3-diacylglucosamine pyrophosphatase LpxH